MVAFSIRRERPGDFTSILALHRSSFHGEEETDLLEALRAAEDYPKDLSWVALQDGQLAGHILFPRIAIDSPLRGSVPALALAPLAVLPAMQRQGIGSALVRHGLGSARQAGHRIVIVVGHPEYYARFGFVSASRKGLEPPFPVPDDAFMVLELTKGALQDITGTVRYPAVFNAASGPDD